MTAKHLRQVVKGPYNINVVGTTYNILKTVEKQI